MEVSVTRWSESGSPTEQFLRQKMADEGLDPYIWSNGPNDHYTTHTHPYDKIIYVVQGSITWILDNGQEKIETRAGDRLELPEGILHAAHVGPQGVLCLEAHMN